VSWALAEESDRKLLAAVVSSGLVMDIGKRGAVATPMFKIGGQPVRLVLLSVDKLFPGELSTAEGQLFGETTSPLVPAPEARRSTRRTSPTGPRMPEHSSNKSRSSPRHRGGPTRQVVPGARTSWSAPVRLSGGGAAAHRAKAPSLGRSERYTYLAAEAFNLYDSAGEVIAHQDHPGPT